MQYVSLISNHNFGQGRLTRGITAILSDLRALWMNSDVFMGDSSEVKSGAADILSVVVAVGLGG